MSLSSVSSSVVVIVVVGTEVVEVDVTVDSVVVEVVLDVVGAVVELEAVVVSSLVEVELEVVLGGSSPQPAAPREIETAAARAASREPARGRPPVKSRRWLLPGGARSAGSR